MSGTTTRPRRPFLRPDSAALAAAEVGWLARQLAEHALAGEFSLAVPARRQLAEKFGLHVEFRPVCRGGRRP